MKRRAFIRRWTGAVVAYGLLSWDLDAACCHTERWIHWPAPFLDGDSASSYLEARRGQIREVARTFNIPPDKLLGLAEDLAQFPNPPMEEWIRAFR